MANIYTVRDGKANVSVVVADDGEEAKNIAIEAYDRDEFDRRTAAVTLIGYTTLMGTGNVIVAANESEEAPEEAPKSTGRAASKA